MSSLPTPSTVFRIDQLWAVISSDEGGEGLCASSMPDGTVMPLIAANETTLEAWLPVAHRLATEGGKKIKIVRFTMREEIMEIEP